MMVFFFRGTRLSDVNHIFSPTYSGKPLLLAEIGVNHDGCVEKAKKLILACKDAGADAVKVQLFDSEAEISKYADATDYQKEEGASSQLELAKSLELKPADISDLFAFADKQNIPILCTPFDFPSLEYLVNELSVSTVKVASSEITNFPFLKQIRDYGLKAILSTGASTLSEVKEAAKFFKRSQALVMHCTSEYPAPLNSLNLSAIQTLARELDFPVGYSDHSEGIEAAVVACVFGARIIEKHVTFDKHGTGPDHKASAEIDELARLARFLNDFKYFIGDGVKQPADCEKKNIPLIRKSLVASRNLKAGDVLVAADIGIKRPCNGLNPGYFDSLVGKKCLRDFVIDEPFTTSDFEDL